MEYLDGVDDPSATSARDFGPVRTAGVGVLVDHLVAGSKRAGSAGGRGVAGRCRAC